MKRPTIEYNNIALFKSQQPAHSNASNSGSGINHVRGVQGISFDFNVDRTKTTSLGTKNLLTNQNHLQPDVSLAIRGLETLKSGSAFTGLFKDGVLNIKEAPLNEDCNFYALLSQDRGEDALDVQGIGQNSSRNISGRDVISFGNAFLSNVSISVGVGGYLTSEYQYLCSNVEAESVKITGSGNHDDMETVYFNDFENMDVNDSDNGGGASSIAGFRHTYSSSAGIKAGNPLAIGEYPVYPLGFAGGSATIASLRSGDTLSSGMGLSGADVIGEKELVLHDFGNTFGLAFTGFPTDGMYLISGTYATTGQYYLHDYLQASGGVGQPALRITTRQGNDKSVNFDVGTFTDADAAKLGVTMTDRLRTGRAQFRYPMMEDTWFTGASTGDVNGKGVPFSGSGFMFNKDVLYVLRNTVQSLRNHDRFSPIYEAGNQPTQQGSGSVIFSDITIKKILDPVIKNPSIDLGGANQKKDLMTYFHNMPVEQYGIATSNYTYEDDGYRYLGEKFKEELISAKDCTVTISSNSTGQSGYIFSTNSIQNFNLNIPIPRDTNYGLGHRFPRNRKVKYPLIGSIDLSCLLSEIDGHSQFTREVFVSDFSKSHDNVLVPNTSKTVDFTFSGIDPTDATDVRLNTGISGGVLKVELEEQNGAAVNPTAVARLRYGRQDGSPSNSLRDNASYIISGEMRVSAPGTSGHAHAYIDVADKEGNFSTDSEFFTFFRIDVPNFPSNPATSANSQFIDIGVRTHSGFGIDGNQVENNGTVSAEFKNLSIVEIVKTSGLAEVLDQDEDLTVNLNFVNYSGGSNQFTVSGAKVASQSVNSSLGDIATLDLSMDFDASNFETPVASTEPSGEFTVMFRANNSNTGFIGVQFIDDGDIPISGAKRSRGVTGQNRSNRNHITPTFMSTGHFTMTLTSSLVILSGYAVRNYPNVFFNTGTLFGDASIFYPKESQITGYKLMHDADNLSKIRVTHSIVSYNSMVNTGLSTQNEDSEDFMFHPKEAFKIIYYGDDEQLGGNQGYTPNDNSAILGDPFYVSGDYKRLIYEIDRDIVHRKGYKTGFVTLKNYRGKVNTDNLP